MLPILPLLFFAISTTVTPGPNNFMIMNSALNFGVRRSLPHFFGISLGFPLMLAAVASGLSVFFYKFPFLYQWLKFVGGAYMLYLAWLVLRSNFAGKSSVAETAKPLSFVQGILFQWVNPKAWMMAVGATTLYITAATNRVQQITLTAFIFFITCLVCVGCWMLFGTAMKTLLKSEVHQNIFKGVIVLLLILSVVMIFFD